MKHILWIFAFLAVLSAKPAIYTVHAETRPISFITGKNWVYSVPFKVQNPQKIAKLIQCESQGVNISRADSDGIFSDGILQFHRSAKGAPIGSGTWAWMEKISGISGSPIDPEDAIRMTDWAISHGLGSQWSCWRIEKL